MNTHAKEIVDYAATMKGRFKKADFTQYPKGWFFAAESQSLKPGDVKTVHYFDQDIVLFRGKDNHKVEAVEPYCKHLGAHLGHGGTVVGDRLRCPFHGWQYGQSGVCEKVPLADTAPKATLKKWPVIERHGVIFIWYSFEEGEPEAFPDIDYLDDAGWKGAKYEQIELKAPLHLLAENTVDEAHFAQLHTNFVDSVTPITFDNYGRNAEANLVLTPNIKLANKSKHSHHQVFKFHSGAHILFNEVKHNKFSLKFMVFGTPVDKETIHAHFLVTNFSYGSFTNPIINRIVRFFMMGRIRTLFIKEDGRVWQNMRHNPRPILSKADGPILPYRDWLSQYYPAKTEDVIIARSKAS